MGYFFKQMQTDGRVPFGAAHIIGIAFPVNAKAGFHAMPPPHPGDADDLTERLAGGARMG